MRRLLAYKSRALRAALRFDRGDLGVSSPGSLLQLLQPREVRAQLADHVGLGARHVAVVVQLAGDSARFLTRQEELHPALFAIQIAQREKPSEGLLARSHLRLERLAALGERL